MPEPLSTNTKPVDVKVLDFGRDAESALKKILNSVESINSGLSQVGGGVDKLSDDINDSNDAGKKQYKDQLVRSQAADRKTSAAERALRGDIDKGFSVVGKLKDIVEDAFKQLLSMIGDIAKESLRSYDENTRNMRKQFLTTEEIKANLLKGDEAKQKLAEMGIKVNSSETKNIVSELAAANADVSSLTADQIAAITMMNKTMGVDVKTALSKVKGATDEELKTYVRMSVNAADQVGRAGTQALMSKVNETWFKAYADKSGGSAAALESLQGVVTDLDAALGDFGLSGQAQADAAAELAVIASGRIQDSKQEELINLLALKGKGDLSDPHALMEGIKNAIRSGKDLAALEQAGLSKEFVASIQNAQEAFKNTGKLSEKKRLERKEGETDEEYAKRRAEENKERINQSQKGGKFGGFIDSVMTGINTATGGLFSGLSAEINEMFGDNLSMETLVSNGFKTIIEILGGILASKIIGNPLELFGKIPGLSKLGPTLSKIGPGISKLGPAIGKTLFRVGAQIITKIPIVAAGAAAAAGVYAAAASTVDSINRYNKIEEAEASLKDARSKKADFEKRYEEAQLLGNEDDIKKYGALLNEINSQIPELEKNLQDAEDNKTAAHKTSVEFDKKIAEENQKLMADRDNARKNEQLALEKELAAKAAGNKEEEERYRKLREQKKKEAEDLNKQIEENNDKKRAVSAAEKGFFATGIASLFHVFGSELSAEGILTIDKITSGISDFFTETIPNAVSTAIKYVVDGIKYTADGIKSIISGVLTYISDKINTIRNFIADNIVNPVKNFIGSIIDAVVSHVANNIKELVDFFTDIADWFNENIIAPILEFKQKVGNFINDKFVNPFKKFFQFDWLPEPVKKVLFGIDNFVSGAVDSAKDIASSVGGAVKKAFMGLFDFKEDGGVVTSATPAVVGEAGKEAILPLTKPEELKKVLQSLTDSEKFSLLKILLGFRSSITFDMMADAVRSVVGNRDTSMSQGTLQATDLTNNIIRGAAAQKGRRYTEMVCNQLVEAALKYAGFTPPTTGVVTRHFNHPKMHLVLNDPINGISTSNPALIPGMIMFSHPFTQAEADKLNAQKGGKRKAGDPGHMGIYAGDGKWWNSTSSTNFVDYSSGKGVKSSASGVALTEPMKKGTYKLFAAGYYEGMFDGSVARKLPTANSTPSVDIKALDQESKAQSRAKQVVKQSGLLSTSDIMSVLNEAGITNAAAVSQYVAQANKLIGNANSKEDIIMLLIEIARYLKGIAASPNNRKVMMSVDRPYTPVYGT